MRRLALATAMAALLAAGSALAQDKPVQLKMSSWVPPAHPLNPAFTAWAKDIEKESNGTITATLFPSEQLGKAVDHYDMARDGIADLAYVNPGYQPGRFPVIAAGELPFLMENADGGTEALDAWYRHYVAQEMKDVHFCFAFVHDPGTFHSNKKIMLPSDISGMKIRPANATIGNLVTLLGGTNVQASAPEVRDVLERHVADAVTFPWGSVILFGIDKVVKYHMDVPLYVTTFVWVMNQAKYDAMSPAQKKVIDDHCTTDWALKVAAPWSASKPPGATSCARARPRGLQDLRQRSRRLAQGGRTADRALGRRRAQGRRRSRRGDGRSQGRAREVQGGLLSLAPMASYLSQRLCSPSPLEAGLSHVHSQTRFIVVAGLDPTTCTHRPSPLEGEGARSRRLRVGGGSCAERTKNNKQCSLDVAAVRARGMRQSVRLPPSRQRPRERGRCRPPPQGGRGRLATARCVNP